MPSDTTNLFESLGRRGHDALLERAQGTLRFELANGRKERWTVAVDRGDVVVSHANHTADCTVRSDRALFDAMARGEVNAMAAVLRGEVTLEGDPTLFLLFQRLFPASPPPG